MQEKSIAPEVKAALARCFAAHKALRSYSAEVVVTVRGIPNQKEGTVRIALARPGRLRIECAGPRAQVATSLLVAQGGYLYEALASSKTFQVKRIPREGDGIEIGIEDTSLLPLPLFGQLMVESEGLDFCLKGLRTLTQEPGKLVFTGEGRFKTTMAFDEATGLLREVRLTQGSSIEIREVYQKVRANPSLPTSLWQFVPPAGFTDENAPVPPQPPAPSLGPGAVTTPSGLQYKDIRVGSGPAAVKGSTVTFHYKGYLTGGRVFDSSREKASPMPIVTTLPSQMPLAFNGGVLGMRPGGIRKLVVPPQLGYGDQGAGKLVPPNATLIYEIEVLAVKEPTLL